MNYMPEVLKMLGIETGEKFNIKELTSNPHHFDGEYVLYNSYDCNLDYGEIVELLMGTYKIEKLPWKPLEDDTYYFVESNGDISNYFWENEAIDFSMYNSGNCFQTRKEITDEIRQRVMTEMKIKYENS